ncbi:2OG-Fe(II) oxygenase superfamily protein [Sarocladium implicatum]|nr:2OG-Fe(II) oxygenase superfamily protein [Sarocladium implicatum]
MTTKAAASKAVPSTSAKSGWVSRITAIAALSALTALSWPYLSPSDPSPASASAIATLTSNIQTYLFPHSPLDLAYQCDASHSYTTQILSLDPLVIYIHNFLSPADISSLLTTADPKFKPSTVTRGGRTAPDPDRTSITAFLPANDSAVSCVLDRARDFAGTILEGREVDEMGKPQLVRYGPGQKFNLHYDWYNIPQRLTVEDGSYRFWNRVGSFFAVLEDECEDGETWFPNVTTVTGPRPQMSEGVDKGSKLLWRTHENGGLAVRPVKGNALFWINLDEEGKGDKRVRHAGLPVTSGQKTAMNIWPRRYFYK